MSTHDAPVVRRIKIPQNTNRSGTRGRWQPSGWTGGSGKSGSIAAYTGVYNLAFECAHDGGDLPGRRLWIALGMKTEPTRRPADGHLSARVLSSLLASLTTSRGESVRWLPS